VTKETPEEIIFLQPNEIFVFGSNLSGRHGKGAALLAKNKWGAQQGVSVGLTGRTYAIPTVNASVTQKLPLATIEVYIDTFVKFAKANKDLTFLVTKIGCGLAGWEVKDIAPLFLGAQYVKNIALPKEFIKILEEYK
jgi:hypothetical protein